MKRAWFGSLPPSRHRYGRRADIHHIGTTLLELLSSRGCVGGLNPEACKKLIVQLWVVGLVPPLRRSTGPGRPCLRKERPQIMFDLAFTVAYSAGAFVAVGVILRGLAA